MTKAEIIKTYYLSEEINEAIQKVSPVGLFDDTRQHVFSILCSQPDYVIINLHNQDKLNFYIIRVLLITVRGKRNEFERLHKQPNTVYADSFFGAGIDTEIMNDELIDRKENERLMQMCEAELKKGCDNEEDRQRWYQMSLLKEYIDCGSYRCVEAKLNICHKTVFNAVKKAKEYIRSKVLQQCTQ